MEKRYEKPIQATYLFLYPNYDGTFRRLQADVDVIGESDKRYLVRLKYPILNHLVGDEIRVLKKNIRFHQV